MAKTPRKAPEVMLLAAEMIAGMQKYPSDFNDAPVNFKKMEEELNSFKGKYESYKYSKSVLENALKDSDDSLDILIHSIVLNSEYCRRIAGDNDALYTAVGLTPPKESKTKNIPGQPTDFIVTNVTPSSVAFEFKKSLIGGKVVYYILERKPTGDNNLWENVGSTMQRKIQVSNQPQGSYDYRIIAVNAVGNSLASNTLTIKF